MALLNEADAIYLGSTVADKVFLGVELIWPPGSVLINRNYVYEDASAGWLVGTFSTDGGDPPYTYTLIGG